MQLADDLGITQKTAWFMGQRIRFALKVKSYKKLEGVIQADETFVGGKNKNRHADKKVTESQGRSVKDKTPVLGIIAAGGKLHTTVIPDTKAKTIKPIITELFREGSIVVTDEWLGYAGTAKRFSYIVINHNQGEYVRGAFHTNTIEGFWSLLKRGIYGIYHQVSAKHLHRYCDEFSFRYNSWKIANNLRFDFSLKSANCRLTDNQLTGKE